jgi:hypothetical protein
MRCCFHVTYSYLSAVHFYIILWCIVFLFCVDRNFPQQLSINSYSHACLNYRLAQCHIMLQDPAPDTVFFSILHHSKYDLCSIQYSIACQPTTSARTLRRSIAICNSCFIFGEFVHWFSSVSPVEYVGITAQYGKISLTSQALTLLFSQLYSIRLYNRHVKVAALFDILRGPTWF